MSGLRNLGQVIDGTFEKGEYDPKDSTINFAVPSENNLYHNTEQSNQFFSGNK